MNASEMNNKKQNEHRNPPPNVLIADNDQKSIRIILETLARRGIRANLANDEKSAIDFFDKNDCDLLFISDQLSAKAAQNQNSTATLRLMHQIQTNWPEMPVVIIAKNKKEKNEDRQQFADTIIDAIRAGCCDFLIEPIEQGKFEKLLDTFLPNHCIATAESAQQGPRTIYKIVGKSPKLLQTINLAKKIAPTSAPVLVNGESGTGKELISFLIHQNSKRAQGPYIKVNCAALSDSLLESELFGHEKGAFTGAYAQRKGRFEMAHGGTLLLDEISETPLKFQSKLLRVLEQQDFERVGGNDSIRVNVRIISTTNKDLLQEVAEGRFRQDLYYRLSSIRIIIPPLRNRREDLPDLVWHFVNLYTQQVPRRITKLDSATLDIFAKYHWPGNIRQLRNVVLTSLILGVGSTLSLADVSWLFDELQPLPQENKLSTATDQLPISGLGGVPLEQVERRAILDTLRQTEGNQTKAAKVLGISDRTLRDKIRRYRRQGVLQPV